MRPAFLLFLVALTAPAGAEPPAPPEGLDGFVTADRLPVPDQPFLAAGRTVWAGSCENCHGGNKLTGAPKITSSKAWAPRISQGMEVLVDHAINGFIGPRYTEMPARGGNEELSDAAVSAAVAFMVWASGGTQAALDFAQASTKKE